MFYRISVRTNLRTSFSTAGSTPQVMLGSSCRSLDAAGVKRMPPTAIHTGYDINDELSAAKLRVRLCLRQCSAKYR